MTEKDSCSGHLSCGHCQYSPCPQTTILRRSGFEWDGTALSSQFQLVALGENVHLCRLNTGNTSPSSDSFRYCTGMILKWSSAVTLKTVNSGSMPMFVQHLVESMCVSPAFTFSDIEGRKEREHSARLFPIQQQHNQTMNFVATFPRPPIIPLSVVFRRKVVSVCKEPTNLLLPLQLARLKRRLNGLCILYRDRIVTTVISISVGDITCEMTVESVSCQKAPNVEIGLFILTPSTRITIIENEDSAPAETRCSNDTSAAQSSAATNILLDTIRVLTKFRNADVPRFFLLTGAPGVGKTHAIRSAIQYSQAPIYAKFLLGSGIIAASGTSGTQGLSLEGHFVHLQKKSTERICILFLDECDALMSSHALASVLARNLDLIALRFKRIIVVAATNIIDSVPQFLRRAGRFEHELIIQPPSSTQRRIILESLVGEVATCLEEIAEMTIGFVPADLHALVRNARALSVCNTNSLECNLGIAMGKVNASALRDSSLSKPPKATWDCVAGDAGGAKTALVQAIEWPRTRRQEFRRLGLNPPRGILLHGPPGCAKTTLARAAAGSENIAFLSLSPADVFASSYVGEAEAIIRRAFATARAAAPCILFFDEIDSIMGSDKKGDSHRMNRTSGGASPESRVLSTFLNETDGLTSAANDDVLVIGATNRPSTLDAALLRPGRFDKVIYVPPPDLDGRVAIIARQIRQFTNEEDCQHFDVHRLASDEITGWLTGAEIEGAIRKFVIQHLLESLVPGKPTQKMKAENLEHSLRNVRPLLSTPGALKEFKTFESNRVDRR